MSAILMKGTPKGCIIVDENGTETNISQRPETILEERCIQNGCTLEGREKAFRVLTNSSQKAAVLVNEHQQDLWFPTLSKTCDTCQWISYFHVVKAFASANNSCEILCDNGHRETVNCSVRTIQNQLKRCRLFLQKINENY